MQKINTNPRVLFLRLATLSLIAVVLSYIGFAVVSRPTATAITNSTINFQARLLTAAGATVPDGQYNVEFKLYTAASSSGSSQGSCSGDTACVWTETRLTSNKVRVVNGYLTVNLGSVSSFTNINWDQELWLTMNIGGTGTPGWDGEMNPRLKLTSVPYAFRAGQLANTNGANQSSLGWVTQTGSNSILLPNASGTICLQSSVSCGFLTGSATDYIQNQNSSSQTANFRINGTGRADIALQAPLFDTPSATALAIGTTNATAINLQQNTTLASGKTLTIQGNTLIQPASDGIAFNIKSSLANNMFTVDTSTARVGIGLGGSVAPTLNDAGLEIKGALRFSGANGTYADSYITPKVGGGSVNTLINIVNYDPGAFAQLIALGLPSGANSSSRVISLFDARATTHQPTLAVLSPDQNQIAGFSWDGSDTTFLTKTSSNNMALQANGLNILTLQNVSGVARLGVGNGSPAYPLDVTGDINSSTALRVGGVQVCTSSGCTSASGSSSYIQNNATSTPQTANFNIQGTNTTTNTGTIRSVLNQDNDLLQFQSAAGTPVAGIRPSGAIYSAAVSDPITDVPANARLFVQPVSNTSTAIIARASSGGAPTGDIIQLQTANGGTNVFKVGVAGATTINNSSTSALLVQNTSNAAALVVDTNNSRVGIGNSGPTVDLDVGPGTLGPSQIVQTRVGDFILQSQQGAANGITASTSRGSNGNITLDGASGGGVYLSPFTTNNNYLAAGGGKVRIGSSSAPTYTLDVTGDINTSTALRIAGTSVCDTTGTTGCVAKSGSGYYIHNDTAVSSANIYVQAATTGTVAAKFQAFNGGSGNIAEFLNGSGTTVGSISSTGAVLYKPSTNSTTAFQVQPSGSSTPVFNVDTQNSRVGVGTAAPTRALDISVSDTSSSTLPLLVRQASTGDVGIEIKNTSSNQSFYVGMDTGDSGKFKITSNTPAGSPNMGTTTTGSQTDSSNSNFMNTQRVTAGATGTITTLYATVGAIVGTAPNNQAQMAIYSNSGGEPGTLLASSGSTTLATGQNTFTLSSPLSVTSGTIYWIAYNTNGSASNQNNLRNETSGGVSRYASQPFGTWPSSFGGTTPSALNFSMYAVIQSSSSDVFSNNLLQMTSSGQMTLRNVADSTSAFQIQNTSSVNMFSVDTSSQRVYIGPTAGDTTGTLLVLGNKTNSGDPTGVAGAMYYNSGTGNFRCYNAGAWQNCVGGLISSNTTASTAISNCTGACAAFNLSSAIPANYCQPGRVITVTASGVYSNAAATTPGLSLGVYYGTDASVRGNDVLIGAASPSLVPVTAGMTNAGWRLDFTIICFSATSMNGQGRFMITSNSTAGSINSVSAILGASASTTVTSTSNKNLYIFPTWSAASASNTITLHQLIVTGT